MIITTSRKPSRRSRTLGRDLERVLGGVYVTRGKASYDVLVDKARRDGEYKIVVISDIHGNPGKIQVINLTEDDWSWDPLIINISGVSLQREVLSEQELKLKKVTFRDLAVVNETKHDIVSYFGLEPNPESRNKIIVKDDVLTFYMGSREVGPRIKIKEWYYADRD